MKFYAAVNLTSLLIDRSIFSLYLQMCRYAMGMAVPRRMNTLLNRYVSSLNREIFLCGISGQTIRTESVNKHTWPPASCDKIHKLIFIVWRENSMNSIIWSTIWIKMFFNANCRAEKIPKIIIIFNAVAKARTISSWACISLRDCKLQQRKFLIFFHV